MLDERSLSVIRRFESTEFLHPSVGGSVALSKGSVEMGDMESVDGVPLHLLTESRFAASNFPRASLAVCTVSLEFVFLVDEEEFGWLLEADSLTIA
jgi:hypothetical protein